MAKNALLIWCAGSALVCGTAALATTSLWRVPAAPDVVAAPSGLADLAPPAAPGPLAGLDAPADGPLPLASISFFEPGAAGASSLFRGTVDAAPAVETAAPEPEPAFTEVRPAESEPDHRLRVLPPPRPNFQLARLDPSSRAPIAEVPSSQPAPGFETPAPVPQSSPNWNWNEVFQQPQQPSGRERVLNAGIASWYGPGFHGRKTASGERFDQNDLTAAHRTLPFGTRVRVVDEKTGRSVIVRINDRGPFAHGRVIDLSKGAAQALGVQGLARVKLVAAN